MSTNHIFFMKKNVNTVLFQAWRTNCIDCQALFFQKKKQEKNILKNYLFELHNLYTNQLINDNTSIQQFKG